MEIVHTWRTVIRSNSTFRIPSATESVSSVSSLRIKRLFGISDPRCQMFKIWISAVTCGNISGPSAYKIVRFRACLAPGQSTEDFRIHYRIFRLFSFSRWMRRYFKEIFYSLFDKLLKNVTAHYFKGRIETGFHFQTKERNEEISGFREWAEKSFFFSSQKKSHHNEFFFFKIVG